MRENEILQARDRVKQIENNISHDQNTYPIYNKRNEYYTVFDDKKILEKKALKNSPNLNINYGRNGFTPLKVNDLPLQTNIMPTTYSTYGAYYNMGNQNNLKPNINMNNLDLSGEVPNFNHKVNYYY